MEINYDLMPKYYTSNYRLIEIPEWIIQILAEQSAKAQVKPNRLEMIAAKTSIPITNFFHYY